MNSRNSSNSPGGFLKGIRPGRFLDNVAEWHALINGFCEVLCPWRPRYGAMKPDLAFEIASEHHYYMFGRALGTVAWLILAVIIKEVLF